MLAEAANVHTRRWARALVGRGWTVTVLSTSDQRIDGVSVRPLRVPPFGCRYPRRWWGRYAQYLCGMARHSRADLVHVHFLKDYPLRPLVELGVPLVVSTWGSDVVVCPNDRPDTQQQRRRKVWLLQQAAAVTATTDYLADRTAAYGGIGREGIRVIPFGVDWRRFGGRSDRASGDGLTVGFLKHLESRYGPQVLVAAMPIVLDRFPAARFLMVGDGPAGPDLVAQAAALGVEHAIEWAGAIPHEQVPAAMARMDVFVMPSMIEAFGVSAVEAQAAGVPVVFSDLPGVGEAVQDGVGGLAVPAGDAAALADAICRLLADAPLGRRLGEQGRRTIRQRFDFDDNVTEMERVYRQVTADRLCPAG